MFQFPRFPPGYFRVTSHHACRVAPFGDLWITGCQRLPRAFRRVATSFIGVQRQGIHRVPIIPVAPRVSQANHPARLVPRRDIEASRRSHLPRPSPGPRNPDHGVDEGTMGTVLVVLVRQDLPTRTSCSSFIPARLVPGGPILIVPFHCQCA
jgi:hypothetical protein